MFKHVFEKITGLDKIRETANSIKNDAVKTASDILEEAKQALEEAQHLKDKSLSELTEAEKQKSIATANAMSEKDKATAEKKPWVNVIKTHTGKSVRHGYFELDWNDYFVESLREAGYGNSTDPAEAIVDLWFRELCASVVVDADYEFGPVDAGSIDPTVIKNNI